MNTTLYLLPALLALTSLSASGQTRSHAAAPPDPATAHFQIRVDPDSKELVVLARRQDAIDLLYPSEAAEARERRRYNGLAADLFERLGAATALPAYPVAGPMEDVQRMYDLHQEAYGAPRRLEVLGSAPRPEGGTYTYVEVEFEQKTVPFRLLWSDGALVTLYPGSPIGLVSRVTPPSAATASRESFR